jgi:hypothetical protein
MISTRLNVSGRPPNFGGRRHLFNFTVADLLAPLCDLAGLLMREN